jgi:DNA polymerase III delta subunit
MTLEEELIAALASGDRERAKTIAAALHARGIDAVAIEAALATQPQLEEQLWAVLQEVIPIARRALKRRAIRAAEERDWGDWEEGRRQF